MPANLPIEEIDPAALSDFAGLALAMVFNDLIEDGPEPPDLRLPTSFAIKGHLNGDRIVGHCHPDLGGRPTNRLSWASSDAGL